MNKVIYARQLTVESINLLQERGYKVVIVSDSRPRFVKRSGAPKYESLPALEVVETVDKVHKVIACTVPHAKEAA